MLWNYPCEVESILGQNYVQPTWTTALKFSSNDQVLQYPQVPNCFLTKGLHGVRWTLIKISEVKGHGDLLLWLQRDIDLKDIFVQLEPTGLINATSTHHCTLKCIDFNGKSRRSLWLWKWGQGQMVGMWQKVLPRMIIHHKQIGQYWYSHWNITVISLYWNTCRIELSPIKSVK